MSSQASVRRLSTPHRADYACAAVLRLALTLLIVLTFGTITPLAYGMPSDQTWIGGFYDNADYDDVILAVISVDGASNRGGSVFFPSAAITQLRSSTPPVSVTSRPRLTLADRAPPLR